MVVVHPHFQLFLYVFTFVAAVCLGLLFVKQKGVADAADTPSTYQADFDRILRESTKVADFEQILANQNYVDQKCKEAAAVAVEACAAERWVYADAIWRDDAATLDDLLDAAETLEEAARTARRVLGGEHPFVKQIERSLQESRAAYDARVGDDRTSMRWDFACPACGHGEAFLKQLQIRSAPWPQYRTFYRCCGRGCGHRWKEEPEIDY